jgi:DNA-binding transcriptional LysR family regulator
VDAVSDLGFFVLVAKSGSLAAAAQQLGVTPPTASKRLAALERRLGVRLLNRTTRRMSLTAEGEAFLGEGSRLLHDLTQLEQRLSGARAVPRGLLRVHATLGFGRRHVTPAVARFADKYPEVEVQLDLGDRLPNLVEQGYDVAVRIGELADTRLTARLLAANARLLCASPAYLRNAGEPTKPADLQSHQCIVIRESDETYGSWQLSRGTQRETVKVRGRLSTNDGESALDWALKGHGILMRSQWDAARYLRSGRLLVVLPQWKLPPADIYAVYPTKQDLSAKTRAFVEHLAGTFAKIEF